MIKTTTNKHGEAIREKAAVFGPRKKNIPSKMINPIPGSYPGFFSATGSQKGFFQGWGDYKKLEKRIKNLFIFIILNFYEPDNYLEGVKPPKPLDTALPHTLTFSPNLISYSLLVMSLLLHYYKWKRMKSVLQTQGEGLNLFCKI